MIRSSSQRDPDSSPGSSPGLSPKRSRLEEDGPDESVSHFEPQRLSPHFGSIAGLTAHLTREERFHALNNIYKPSQSFVFPQHTEGSRNHKRSFQHKWLAEHPWLAYSKEKDGGYCVPCAFFCKSDEGLGKLVNTPLTRYKDAVDTFRQHSRKAYHVQQIQKNHEMLKSVIKTVTFCGKQNIALRGHRDDTKHLDQPGNHGNFHALLDFRIESGDKNLQRHLATAPRNARYT